MIKRKNKSLCIALVIILSMFFNICAPCVLEVKAYTQEENSIGNFTQGKRYYGFKLVDQKKIHNGTDICRNFIHEKSGARLFSVQNKDPNKHFSISFRTPSYNDKGAAHILEHCVLVGGSKKYPVKQLLKEVLETSLSKNLNGMTTPDTTIYPFSTTNEKEFSNIMDIYLDMVFNPSFYNDQRIFKEEGWYYDINNEDLKYNGVVYNEMKGSLSSPASHLYNSICKSLYPNTTYAFISGGDPKHIPDLTFAELKQFHKKYYKPSNSYIFLYGDMNIKDKLKSLDEHYLNKYKKEKVNSTISEQKPFKQKRYDIHKYPILKTENESGKSFLTYNFSINTKSAELDMAFQLLNEMLLNNPNSPLLRNLRKHGFNNVSGAYIPNQRQGFYSIIVGNTDYKKASEFENVVNATLKEICNKGLDKQIILNTINFMDLNSRWNSSYRETTGDDYNNAVLSRWIYDEDPMSAFIKPYEFARILTSLKRPYFEHIINKFLLNNTHSSIMILRPEKGMLEQQKIDEYRRLKQYKDSLSEDEYKKLRENTRELRTWLNTQSNEKDIDKIPRLKLKDINPRLELISLYRKKENGIPILYHQWDTKGTSYINLYFNSSSIKKEEVPYMQLLATILGNVSTKKSRIGELYNKEMNLTTGIKYEINSFSSAKQEGIINPQFKIEALTLSENTKATLDLIKEEITKSKYKDKKLLKKIIKNIRLESAEKVYEYPHILALTRNFSYYSKGEKYNDSLIGIGYMEFIKSLDEHFDEKYEDIVKNLDKVSNKIFNKHNLTISLTSDKSGYAYLKKDLLSFTRDLEKEKLNKEEIEFVYKKNQEAFNQNTDVLYNVQGFNYRALGEKYKGSMKVLKNILDLDYLWPKVRVKGGAYGVNFLLNKSGVMGIVSYRDPNLKETLEAYKGIPEYLKKLSLNDKELESYKISSLAEYCHTKTTEEKVKIADNMYFSGIKRDDLEKELKEIKNTTLKDVKGYEELFNKGLKQNNITVIGNRSKIQKQKDIFNKIKGI
ncbi:insulinase family protein [Hathewaya limosa]|uniref:Zn-dependent M16 (Insulinase) family peptidase n=1 Tax=Hathewaya limosa TaxID=1536 RepID=A0ABU0JTR7_HATLI|nr:insulinase family protein [Hathewaya limosa]MDQ0480493.1 Zn-dependent M16 (insulinase) family peptidase [Hathewaya limosa]